MQLIYSISSFSTNFETKVTSFQKSELIQILVCFKQHYPIFNISSGNLSVVSWQAWRIIDPRAGEAFAALRKAGVKIAVVSNFDTRLRLILKALDCDHWFDAMAVSAEVIFIWKETDRSLQNL